MTPIASSSAGTWFTTNHLDKTSDGRHHTYWRTETGANEWVTYDLGGPTTFRYLVLDVFTHQDDRNIRGYRFEVSDDGVTYRTVLAGTNPDNYGSSYKYVLDRAVTARYLRFTLVDTFCAASPPPAACGAYFVLSDLQVGRLVPADAAAAAPPTRSRPGRGAGAPAGAGPGARRGGRTAHGRSRGRSGRAGPRARPRRPPPRPRRPPPRPRRPPTARPPQSGPGGSCRPPAARAAGCVSASSAMRRRRAAAPSGPR